MLIALCAAIFLCLQVANVKSLGSAPTYRLYATFDNVGGLKARSPVKIGGVVIGRVAEISLDPQTYLPRVAMDIDRRYNHIPDTSSWRSGPQACWESSIWPSTSGLKIRRWVQPF